MFLVGQITILVLLATSQLGYPTGEIVGTVRNGSDPSADVADIEVVLRATIDGQFAVVESTRTDAQGEYRFADLPITDDVIYLPGANLGDVHFPGPRVRLTVANRVGQGNITLYRNSAGPSPLVIENHHVIVRRLVNSIEVREILEINNPSALCYVGEPPHPGGPPVTLRLDVPAKFQRITFDEEAWGKQFRVVNDHLVTSLPWPPGSRQLAFTYWVDAEKVTNLWQQTMILPCRVYVLEFVGELAENSRCDLPVREFKAADHVIYRSDQPLSTQQVVSLEFAQVTSASSLARRAALGVLFGLVVVVCVTASRHHLAGRAR